MFNFNWYVYGGIAFLLAVIGLISAIKGRQTRVLILVFCSLTMGTLTLLEEFRFINISYSMGDNSAYYLDSLPHICEILVPAVWIGIGINLISVVVAVKKRDR